MVSWRPAGACGGAAQACQQAVGNQCRARRDAAGLGAEAAAAPPSPGCLEPPTVEVVARLLKFLESKDAIWAHPALPSFCTASKVAFLFAE